MKAGDGRCGFTGQYGKFRPFRCDPVQAAQPGQLLCFGLEDVFGVWFCAVVPLKVGRTRNQTVTLLHTVSKHSTLCCCFGAGIEDQLLLWRCSGGLCRAGCPETPSHHKGTCLTFSVRGKNSCRIAGTDLAALESEARLTTLFTVLRFGEE